jgi:hypothetical protein
MPPDYRLPSARLARYTQTLRAAVPRLLSLQNRNPFSQTCGCFDRDFWNYKTLVDFPSATYQQGVLGLAALYAHPSTHNPYHAQAEILDAALAGMRYWARIQNRDGSLDEYYQNERSFCATAFTTFAVSEAVRILGNDVPAETRAEVIPALRRAGDWLAAHDNPSVANQMMAALNALYNLLDLTGDPHYAEAVTLKRAALYDWMQSGEGWFSEYGGADIGYSFIGIDLLAHHLSRSGDPATREALRRLLDFVAAFVHPDGSAGGEYGSRNTAHIMPYGLELLAAAGECQAAQILHKIHRGLASGAAQSPGDVDDKYFVYFYFNTYALALTSASAQLDSPDAPLEGDWPAPDVRLFPASGLISASGGGYACYISLRKGGVLRAYEGERLAYADTGYFAETAHGETWASQAYNPEAEARVERQDDGSVRVGIVARFARLDDSLPLRRWLIPFKLFVTTLLRLAWLGGWFERALKRAKITRADSRPLQLERVITLGADQVIIEDTLHALKPVRFRRVGRTADGTAVFSASSRYWTNGQITRRPPPDPTDLAGALNATREAIVLTNVVGGKHPSALAS